MTAKDGKTPRPLPEGRGLRRILLKRELWERRVRSRLRREIAKADAERAIGAAEMVRLTAIPYRPERDLFRDP